MLTAKLHLLLGACFWHLWRSTSSLALQMMKREVPSPPHPKRAESHSWYEAFPYQFNMDSETIKFLVRHATSHLWIGTPRNELQFVNTGWLQIHLTIKQSPSKKRKHRDCFRQNCNKSWLLRTCHLSTRSFWHSQKFQRSSSPPWKYCKFLLKKVAIAACLGHGTENHTNFFSVFLLIMRALLHDPDHSPKTCQLPKHVLPFKAWPLPENQPIKPWRKKTTFQGFSVASIQKYPSKSVVNLACRMG